MEFDKTDLQSINTIRAFAMDAVEKAKSGHPGMPMGTAPLAYVLWKHFLRFNFQNPDWINRDRFVLSAGHGSMLLYSLLYLFGYPLSLEEIKNFRQLGSQTPGHPEFGLTSGVEVTTGPLGQGIANAVGFAIAQKYLASFFNKPNYEIIDYRVFVLAGDGCLQEGISHEACSIAGKLGLDNLILIHDNNHITIDGNINLSSCDDQIASFQAKNWHTIKVQGDGNDLSAIFNAFQEAIGINNKPVFLSIETCIGYGSPSKAGSEKSHGAPLGEQEILLAKEKLQLSEKKEFTISQSVAKRFQVIREQTSTKAAVWNQQLISYSQDYPKEHQLLQGAFSKNLLLNAMKNIHFEKDSFSTRAASGVVLNHLMPKTPFVLGGSADLTGSNNTGFEGMEFFCKENYAGRYINYGIREHAMGAILNGISISPLLRCYGGTFLCFSDYMRPAIRLAALSSYPSIFIFTHDSIGLGEDGPTHQPVEHLSTLRAIPNLFVFRPADAFEVKYAWQFALQSKSPTAIILSRQNLPVLQDNNDALKGAYVLIDSPHPSIILMATGSEVSLALEAAKQLQKCNITVRVISVLCWEVFEKQSVTYQNAILYQYPNRIAIEAGIKQGWEKYLGDKGKFIGMQGFGASAPAKELFEYYKITVSEIVKTAQEMIATKC